MRPEFIRAHRAQGGGHAVVRIGWRRRAGRALGKAGMPGDLFTRQPRVVWFGRESVRVENHLGIVEVSDVSVRFETRAGTLAVTGTRLTVSQATSDNATVRGEIGQLSYTGSKRR